MASEQSAFSKSGFVIEKLDRRGLDDVYEPWLATPELGGPRVVIKRVHSHLSSRTDFAEMFMQEARSMLRLRHPNIVATYDIGRADGSLVTVSEHVSGVQLSDLLLEAIRRSLRLPLWFSLHVIGEVLKGIVHAHENGRVVHRNVAAESVILSSGGVVKLDDFGIAKSKGVVSDDAGQVRGCIDYVAPEVLFGTKVDPRADVFSAAVLLYECLTKRRPFAGHSNLVTAQMICSAARLPPSRVNPAVPPELDRIVIRSLEVEPHDRPSSARELLDAITEILGAPSRTCSEVSAVVDRIFGRAEPMSDMLDVGRPDLDPPESTAELAVPEIDPPWGETGELVAFDAPITLFSRGEAGERSSSYEDLVHGFPQRRPTDVSVDRVQWMKAVLFADLMGLDALADPMLPIQRATHVGRLEERTLIRLMADIARERWSGRLVIVESGPRRVARRHIDVIDGAPVYVFTNDPELQAPDLLVQRRIVSATDLPAIARRVIAHGTTIEDATELETGFDASRFWPLVMVRRLSEVARWRAGRYAFDAGAELSRTKPFAASLFDCIPLAASASSPEELEHWWGPRMATRFTSALPIEELAVRYRFTEAHTEIARAILDGAPLGSLVAEGYDATSVLTLAYGLVEAGDFSASLM